MEITLSEDSIIEPDTIKTAIDLQIPIEIFTYSIPPKTKNFISSVLAQYLEQCNLSHLFSKFEYCINELLLNGYKANSKRVYFIHKGLDIENPHDYNEGMKSFRNEISENKDFYIEKQKQQGLHVSLSMVIKDNQLVLSVTNNTIPTVLEQKRITEKIDNCHRYTREEISGDLIDETEGAGLGLNSVCLALKSIGVSKENFQFNVLGKETEVRILYPIK